MVNAPLTMSRLFLCSSVPCVSVSIAESSYHSSALKENSRAGQRILSTNKDNSIFAAVFLHSRRGP